MHLSKKVLHGFIDRNKNARKQTWFLLDVEFSSSVLKLRMIKVSNGLLEEIANCQVDALNKEKTNLMVQGKTTEFKDGNANILRCN